MVTKPQYAAQAYRGDYTRDQKVSIFTVGLHLGIA